jgi:hypothetical protein
LGNRNPDSSAGYRVYSAVLSTVVQVPSEYRFQDKFDDFRSEKQRSKIIFSLVERPA